MLPCLPRANRLRGAAAPAALFVGCLVAFSSGRASAASGTVRLNGAPYRDLATALEAASAGDTIEVTGGVHAGSIVLDTPVRLVGVDRPALDGRGTGSVVEVTAPGVAVEGFLIRGSGEQSHREDSGVLAHDTVVVRDNRFVDVLYGVNLKGAPDSVIAGNVVRGRPVHVARRGDGIRIWESHGTLIEGNEVAHSRDVVIWYSSDTVIRGNDVHDGRYGLHYMYSHGGTIEGNVFRDNSVGSFLMYSKDLTLRGNVYSGSHGPSGYGIGLKDSDRIAVEDNVLSGNRVGLYLDNTPTSRDAWNAIRGNTFAYNDVGITFLPAVKRNAIGGNAFLDNYQHVGVSATGDFEGNEWTPDGQGNYWSNYAGFDADGDGVGDLPFWHLGLFDSLHRRHPELKLFALSPVQTAIEISAQAFPVFRPPPLLQDTAPLMRPPPPAVAPQPADPRPMALVAAVLLSAAGAVAWWGRDFERAERAGPVPAPEALR